MMESGYLDRIPIEIFERILFAVPTYQIPLNEAWVCKYWTQIILKPQFWVLKLKRIGINIDESIWSVLQEFENHEIISCLYNACLYQEYRTHHSPISKFISGIPTEEEVGYEPRWVISDTVDRITLLMASGILVCRSLRFIHLTLKNKNVKVLPLLLKLLGARNLLPISINDDYAFWNFSPRINYFQILKGTSNEYKRMGHFNGCLTTLEGLPSSVGEIRLSICVDDKNAAIDPGLLLLKRTTRLILHLKAGTNISNLPKISYDRNYQHDSYESCNVYIFSGLEESHILWMTELTKKFLINQQIMLIFFNYRLDLKSSVYLLKSIAEAGFDLEYEILCASPTLSSDTENILDDLACTLWPNCLGGFQLFKCDDSLIYHLANDYHTFLKTEVNYNVPDATGVLKLPGGESEGPVEPNRFNMFQKGNKCVCGTNHY